MPIYEYECKEDGRVIELLRPISKADDPVPDPEGKGGTFIRKHSLFAAAGTNTSSSSSTSTAACCPCGKNANACNRN
jgi:predicted nucleic acid-binding Zn ribbon protein